MSAAIPPSQPRAPRNALTERLQFARYRRTRSRADRDALIARYDSLARTAAMRYRRSLEPLDDLMQVAYVGLIKAIERYDPDRGTAFTAFAIPTILGELRRHFRDTTWGIHVPRELQEHCAAVQSASEQLAARNGRSPSMIDVASLTGLTIEQVLEAREVALAHTAVSLDVSWDEGDAGELRLADRLGDEDPRLEHAEQTVFVSQLTRGLSARDRELLRLRFGEGLTQREIGKRIGISQMHVSRLMRVAVDRLAQEVDRPAA
jgi:RNA polymerase sigma-B factor